MSIDLLSCPFCEGPPCPIVQNDTVNRGAARLLDDYGQDGLYVRAFVFCHECGALGPAHDALIYDREDYFAAEAAGVRLWQERDSRHRVMFDDGNAAGLNVYPRADAQGSAT